MKRWLVGLAFAGLLAVQVSPAAMLAWRQTQRLNDGHLLRLAVETRDPRDLLRGEYSVFTYEIGRLQGIGADAAPGGCDLDARDNCRLEVGRDVYVRLAADADANGVHRADEVFFTAPQETGCSSKAACDPRRSRARELLSASGPGRAASRRSPPPVSIRSV